MLDYFNLSDSCNYEMTLMKKKLLEISLDLKLY